MLEIYVWNERIALQSHCIDYLIVFKIIQLKYILFKPKTNTYIHCSSIILHRRNFL